MPSLLFAKSRLICLPGKNYAESVEFPEILPYFKIEIHVNHP